MGGWQGHCEYGKDFRTYSKDTRMPLESIKQERKRADLIYLLGAFTLAAMWILDCKKGKEDTWSKSSWFQTLSNGIGNSSSLGSGGMEPLATQEKTPKAPHISNTSQQIQ